MVIQWFLGIILGTGVKEYMCNTFSFITIALIDDSHIVASPYFDIPSVTGESADRAVESEQETQEAKPKSRIAAEILANGYLLQDHVVAKGLEYDHKYNVSGRFSSFLNTLQSNGKAYIITLCIY
jgi:hypothetical protein